ncbi:MAG TPA: hypothetical protein VMU13_00755, partial [Candidatus Paceibacterota bacterium]|nr:hypothetical protein [Candidatus Paceibacterota bacterium]
ILNFKNSGGTWQSLQQVVATLVGASQWTAGTGGSIYYNAGNVGVGSSSPSTALAVEGTITAPTVTGLLAPINPSDAVNKAYVDASGGGGAGTTPAMCAVTEQTYNGNLGGIAGATAKCQAEFGSGWSFANAARLAAYFGSNSNTNTGYSNLNLNLLIFPLISFTTIWLDPMGSVNSYSYSVYYGVCDHWTNGSGGIYGFSYGMNPSNYYPSVEKSDCSLSNPIFCCNF